MMEDPALQGSDHAGKRVSQFVSLRDVMHELPPDLGTRETFRKVFQNHWFRATTKKRFFYLFAYSLASLSVTFALFINLTLLQRNTSKSSLSQRMVSTITGLLVVIVSVYVIPRRWMQSSAQVKRSLQVAIWLSLLCAFICHSRSSPADISEFGFFSVLHVSALFGLIAFSIVLVLPARIVARWFEPRYRLTALGVALAMQPLGMGLAIDMLSESQNLLSRHSILLACFASLISVVLFSMDADPGIDPSLGAFLMRGYDDEKADIGATEIGSKLWHHPSLVVKLCCMALVTALSHPFVQFMFVFSPINPSSSSSSSSINGHHDADEEITRSHFKHDVNLRTVYWILSVLLPIAHVAVGFAIDALSLRKKLGNCLTASAFAMLAVCMWFYFAGLRVPIPLALLGEPLQYNTALFVIVICQATFSVVCQHLATEVTFLLIASHEALALYHCVEHVFLLLFYVLLVSAEREWVDGVWNWIVFAACLLLLFNTATSRIVYTREDLEWTYQRFLTDNLGQKRADNEDELDSDDLNQERHFVTFSEEEEDLEFFPLLKGSRLGNRESATEYYSFGTI